MNSDQTLAAQVIKLLPTQVIKHLLHKWSNTCYISDHTTISNPLNALYSIKTAGSIKVTPAHATSTPSISGNAMIHIFTCYFFLFICHNIRDGSYSDFVQFVLFRSSYSFQCTNCSTRQIEKGNYNCEHLRNKPLPKTSPRNES